MLLVIKRATPFEIMAKGDGLLMNGGLIEGKWRGLVAWSRESWEVGSSCRVLSVDLCDFSCGARSCVYVDSMWRRTTDRTSGVTHVSLLSLSFIPSKCVSWALTRVSRCVIYLYRFHCCRHLSPTYFGSRVNGQVLWSACTRDFLVNGSVSWVSRPNRLGYATFHFACLAFYMVTSFCHGVFHHCRSLDRPPWRD